MREQLIQYVRRLFARAPKTEQALVMEEEILRNTLDKYDDFLAEGKGEAAAYQLAISGMGDMDALLASLGAEARQFRYSKEELAADARRNGTLLAVAVMLYILSVLPPILLSETVLEDTLGPALMFLLIAIATGLLIYRAKTRIPPGERYVTVAPGERQESSRGQGMQPLCRAIVGIISCLTLLAYFVVSFLTNAWAVTWIIFLIGMCAGQITRAIFDLKDGGK